MDLCGEREVEQWRPSLPIFERRLAMMMRVTLHPVCPTVVEGVIVVGVLQGVGLSDIEWYEERRSNSSWKGGRRRTKSS